LASLAEGDGFSQTWRNYEHNGVPIIRLRVEKGCIDRNGASGLLIRSLCDAEPENMNAQSAAAIACNQGFTTRRRVMGTTNHENGLAQDTPG
jgi:hypothetical protein